jgi:hypothetical protein
MSMCLMKDWSKRRQTLMNIVSALADCQWQGALPTDLEEANDEARREQLRILKARVAMGETELIGPQVWAGLSAGQPAPVEVPLASSTRSTETKTAEGVQEQDKPGKEVAKAITDSKAIDEGQVVRADATSGIAAARAVDRNAAVWER